MCAFEKPGKRMFALRKFSDFQHRTTGSLFLHNTHTLLSWWPHLRYLAQLSNARWSLDQPLLAHCTTHQGVLGADSARTKHGETAVHDEHQGSA